jgi:hypothetical protein
MTCLAIDPGISTGWALFNDGGELLLCAQSPPPVAYHQGNPTRVVIERPQVYQGRKSKADPNDIVTLALGAGKYWERFEARGAAVEMVLPSEWKGQLDKPVCHERMWAFLSPREQAIVHRGGLGVAPKKREDMLDAVALGKWRYGGLRFTGQAIK